MSLFSDRFAVRAASPVRALRCQSASLSDVGVCWCGFLNKFGGMV